MFLSKYLVFIPEATQKPTKKSIMVANALMVELFNYGINPKTKLITTIMGYKETMAKQVAAKILKQLTLGSLNPPLFSHWEERTYFSFDEVITQITGYLLQISGNDLADANYMDYLRKNIVYTDMKKLKMATSTEAEEFFMKLVSTGQSKAQRETLRQFAEYFPVTTYLRSDEARTSVMLATGIDTMLNMRGKPADILRFFAARKDFDQVILPSTTKFDAMTWQERKKAYKYLGMFDTEFLFEAMGNNRNVWKRFFKHTHLFQQQELMRKFPKLAAAAWVSLGNKLDKTPTDIIETVDGFIVANLVEKTEEGALVYRTFASRVMSAIEAKSWKKLWPLLKKKPGYLLRNLASVSNAIKPKHEAAFLELCKQSVAKAQPEVLFSLLQINPKAKYRIIDVKGATVVTEVEYSPYIAAVQKTIKAELKSRFGVKGQIIVDDAIKKNMVPFLSRNQEIYRGTKIPFAEKGYMHFFLHWIQTINRRTDLDHSHIIFKKDGSFETIAFYNSANDYISQSGDITNAPPPHGGTEYSVFRLDEIPKNVKYIAPVINVYSGDNFKELPEAYAGFMFNNSQNFNINRDHVRYDLTQPAMVNIPFIIDMVNKQIIVVDYNIPGMNSIAVSFAEEIENVISAATDLKRMSLKKFAKLLSGDGKKIQYNITEEPKSDKDISPNALAQFIK